MVKRSPDVGAQHVELGSIFLSLQQEMAVKLGAAKNYLSHPGTMGDVSENSWLEMLKKYLPQRYQVEKAFVLDCDGQLSDQIDIVIFDRHFSPFLLHQGGACYVPAESVYGVFEVKQEASKETIAYAARKAESVRRLRRTSAYIAHAGGRFDPKQPAEILAGLLTLRYGWKSSPDKQLRQSVNSLAKSGRLNIGCILEGGTFELADGPGGQTDWRFFDKKQALIQFFLRLLAKLQKIGTVPAIDIDAYAASLQRV